MPNIPDKFYKLSILIGFFLVGFSWTKSNDSYKDYNAKYDKYDGIVDSLELLEVEILFEQENFKAKCSEIEFKHNLDSIYFIEGDDIVF